MEIKARPSTQENVTTKLNSETYRCDTFLFWVVKPKSNTWQGGWGREEGGMGGMWRKEREQDISLVRHFTHLLNNSLA